jgi:hypothetical protein
MAEKVEVDGGGEFNGAILKNAATEATLERLANAMETKQKGLKDKILGIGTKVVEDNIKAQKESTSAFGSFTNTLNSGTKASGKVFDVFSSIVGTGIGTTFSLLSTAGGAFLEFVKNGYTAFQETSKVGASFNNDLFLLRNTAAEAQIPLEEFTQLMRQNSETFARLGMSVTDGAMAFSGMANSIKRDFGDELTGLGFSLSDINEGLATYLEIQTKLGKVDKNNTRDLIDGTHTYLLELDKITKLTGMSRKAQEDLARKVSVDPVIRSMMEGIEGNVEATAKAQANIALLQQLGGDQAVQYAKELAAMRPGPEAAMMAQQLQMSMEDFQKIFTGQIDAQDLVETLKSRREATKALDDETRKQQTAIAMSNEGFAKTLEILKNVEGLGDLEAVQREQDARESVTKALGVFSNTINKIYFNTLSKVISSPVFSELLGGLENLADKFNDNAPKIVRFFDNILTAVNLAMTNFVTNIDKEGIGNALIDLFSDLFKYVGKVITPALKDVVVSMFGTPEEQEKRKAFNSATADEKAKMAQADPSLVDNNLGKLLGNLKEQLTSLLPSFSELAVYLGIGAGGTLLAGMGISAALTALGLSLDGVAVPALALGAAIGMGGLGLGAAFYGLSKIIDAVSNSFTRIKDFFIGMEKIDSTKLSSVGNAIGPLADGVASLTSSGFQTLISGDGLNTFAVALQRFDTVNPEKISAIGPALKSLYDGYSVFTNASIIEGFTGAVSSMFSGGAIDSIASSITKLGKIDSNNLNGLIPVANFFNSLKGLEVDPAKIENVVNSIGILKNIMSQNFIGDTSKIENIVSAIDILKTTMDQSFVGDTSKIENMVSAVGVLKTTMDQNFVGDTSKVDTFTKSINDLVDSLGKLEEQLKKTPTTLTTGETPTIKSFGGSTLSDISGNSPEDLQRQLNMQMAELIQHTVEMKEISKNTSDSISDRRNAI